MPDLILKGCQPEPLMSYLKALGVLRLVGEQIDGDARGAWRGEQFHLTSKLDEAGIEAFFLDQYRPTPIVAPWAGGSGFFSGDNKIAIDAITASSPERLQLYHDVISQVRGILDGLGISTKPADRVKSQLLRRYRRELPDAFIAWMDCALVLQAAGQAFPPILGTGGNDGRLDFSQNFMQRLVALGIPSNLTGKTRGWLRQALFGEIVNGLKAAAIGQFDPGKAGGPNATQGLEGLSLVNPWDYVLMIEGTLLLAGSVARRLGSSQRDKAVFPFTTRSSAVGYGSAAGTDTSSSRGEIWLPLWSKMTSLPELKLVFSEGRAELSGRQSRDGVDFARAVAGLGVDRGIESFTRFGFLKRSGKAYVAAPLGRFAVPRSSQPVVDLVREIDPWLDGFRRAAIRDTAPPRFGAALQRIDAAIFNLCRYGGATYFAELLRSLGQAEREFLGSGRFLADNPTLRPIPRLSRRWIDAAYAPASQDATEFRLALGLASIRDEPQGGVGDLRTNLEPVGLRKGRWTWSDRDPSVVWSGADLVRNLTAVLTRRLMDAERLGVERLPLTSRISVSLADLADFLEGQTDDQRIGEYLWGLVLVDTPTGWRASGIRPNQPLARAYALLKLVFLPHPVIWPAGSPGVMIRPEPEILGRLRAGAIGQACQIARRRLQAAGLIPMPGPNSAGTRRAEEFQAGGHDPARLAASLLFPISQGSQQELARLVLRPKSERETPTRM
jgi:CRISPR-associated protein Csx17